VCEVTAELHAAGGAHVAATKLLGASNRNRDAIKVARNVPEQAEYGECVATIVAGIGDSEFARQLELGTSLALEAVLAPIARQNESVVYPGKIASD